MTSNDSANRSDKATADRSTNNLFTCGDTRRILEWQMSKVDDDRNQARGNDTMTAEKKSAAETNYSKWYDSVTAHALAHSWQSEVSVAILDFHDMS
jgi:hypothetical protein